MLSPCVHSGYRLGAERGDPTTSHARQSHAPSAAPASHVESPSIDVSVLRRDAHYDYKPASSLTKLASGDWLDEGTATVALGEVVGWTDGRSVTEANRDGTLEWINLYAVLEIEVLEAYGPTSATGTDNRIYVEVPRGTKALVDGELPDDGGRPAFSTIEALNGAVPRGTRVIMVGAEGPTAEELRSGTPGSSVQPSARELPNGATLLWPHIQGLIFEDETGGFVSGLTDDEEQWGWLPSGMRTRDGFEYLVSGLDGLK